MGKCAGGDGLNRALLKGFGDFWRSLRVFLTRFSAPTNGNAGLHPFKRTAEEEEGGMGWDGMSRAVGTGALERSSGL